MIKDFKIKRILQGRLFKGDEIVASITKIARDKGITAGVVNGIGAVERAKIGYYDQRNRKYMSQEFSEPMEILSLKGNISIKDNEPFPHIHVVLSREDYSSIGGHLFEAQVFAFEFEIIEFEGTAYERGFDEDTGLFLWKG
ncbi:MULTISPECIES: PPC domain-containing DNA-binding protein [Thermodesulfovibrio]|jgi:predicted DNA-binding protein with PD1-like motif|uniref:PPC domain-containing DNA-binding protein n=1 Tax=Thermodesulfovibrio TaxID=28261 RepID=UPI002608F217|nr:PPC domain-containing DNA-binding protein [Thermodesulfovibrio sp.]